jgi:hypothetical protein
MVGPDIEPGKEFYQRQCGTWSELNPNGVIAGADLRFNIIQHEAGAVGLSHYGQLVDALLRPDNDLGVALEQTVVANAPDDTSYAAAVFQKMDQGPIGRIQTAAGVEPCSTASYDGSSGVCVAKGYLNYPPYPLCP